MSAITSNLPGDWCAIRANLKKPTRPRSFWGGASENQCPSVLRDLGYGIGKVFSIDRLSHHRRARHLLVDPRYGIVVMACRDEQDRRPAHLSQPAPGLDSFASGGIEESLGEAAAGGLAKACGEFPGQVRYVLWSIAGPLRSISCLSAAITLG